MLFHDDKESSIGNSVPPFLTASISIDFPISFSLLPVFNLFIPSLCIFLYWVGIIFVNFLPTISDKVYPNIFSEALFHKIINPSELIEMIASAAVRVIDLFNSSLS